MSARASAKPRPPDSGFERLHLRNVRCFRDIDVPLDPRVTVLIGENGAGKTTIAEAMASLSAGEREGLSAFPLRRGAAEGAIELHERGAAGPAASWTTDERRRLPPSRYLFAYGRYRRVQPPEAPRLAPGGLELLGPEWDEAATQAGILANLSEIVAGRRTTSLFASDHYLLRDIGRHLVELHRHRSAAEIDALFRALDASLPVLGHALDGIRIIERSGRDVAVIGRRGLDLDLRELSDGYQAILVIVLDLLLRRAFLPPAEDPDRRPTTVLIDEVDLHLHPRWQRSVVRQLTQLFPEMQLVLTTHSAAVVQSAIDDGHSVLLLRERDGEVAIAPLPEAARRALRGAQLGSVLVDRHLFGLGSRYSARFEGVEKKVRRLRRKLEAGEATETDRAALLAALSTLEELMADEEERWARQPLMSELARVQIASLRELSAMNEEARRGPA